tara:strand:- start:3102 stop:3521 length:420 start_codon:yes stop_codon:yes gene_type:complete
MNIKNIFDAFNSENFQNDDETSLLMDFSEHPLFWISGFNKIIDNHLFFTQYTVKAFKNISPDININELEKAGEELMFRKAWDYIKSIDLNKNFHVECIKNKASKDFSYNLQISIQFFEMYEEYEKCVLLKNIKDLIESF